MILLKQKHLKSGRNNPQYIEQIFSDIDNIFFVGEMEFNLKIEKQIAVIKH